MTRDTMLWIYVGAAPGLWFVSMESNFIISNQFCTAMSSGIPVAISLGALFGTIVLAAVSWKHLRRMQAEAPIALAAGAALLNACSALVIAAQTIPIWLLAGCR